MTQVSDRPAERPRVREQREERELGAGGVVPEALTRLFNQLWADDGEGSGGGLPCRDQNYWAVPR